MCIQNEELCIENDRMAEGLVWRRWSRYVIMFKRGILPKTMSFTLRIAPVEQSIASFAPHKAVGRTVSQVSETLQKLTNPSQNRPLM